ncbi:uncharacterized protein LOC132644565 [Lycium barbarum]|uniref:uncharacterized protein LOC132644565 n=1 Tax=Lycium barbarum TaxID=112863 RepID=UPI00293F2BA5|nr:uncharacterized protein LOC132644565 [Lycium barbarum]
MFVPLGEQIVSTSAIVTEKQIATISTYEGTRLVQPQVTSPAKGSAVNQEVTTKVVIKNNAGVSGKTVKGMGPYSRRGGGILPQMDKIGFWNNRGMNRQDKQRKISLFMYNNKVGLFGLLETKIQRSKASIVALNLCKDWSFSTNLAHHPSGRILLLWNPLLFTVGILRMSGQLVHCDVEHRGTKHKFVLTMIKDFKLCVGECSLQELRSSGAFYTWNNKHDEKSRVYSKIDRVLVNGAWISTLPSSEVHCGNEGLMDHCPAIITWDNRNQHPPYRFSYFKMWRKAPDFHQQVKTNWDRNIEGIQMFRLVGKLNRLKSTLRGINRKHFTDVEVTNDKVREALEECQRALQKDPTNCLLVSTEVHLAKEYQRWDQARTQFLKAKEQSALVERERLKYKVRVCSSTIKKGPVVSDEHKELLVGEVTDIEVKKALWAIGGDKALGLNGYGSQFFKDYWDTVSSDLIAGVKEFFRAGKILKVWNNTVLTLVPKSDHAEAVGYYRPIACFNTIYKVVSKVLSNRLKIVLPSIISANQSAFVKGRTIVQNILICQDLVRLYKRKQTTSICLIKIDLKKAYDIVE